MKLRIQHLLHYRENGPSIGIRVKAYRRESYNLDAGVIIPIPQWFSNLLKYLSRNRKAKPGEFSI